MHLRVGIISFIFILSSSCTKLEFSPNQSFDNNSPRLINTANIQRINANTAADDTIRFILTGDSQRSYDNAEEFVAMANRMAGIDFAVIAGDISDFGLLQEMEWVHARYKKLNVPYIGVIGNHDLLGNGEQIFKNMYGDLDYSFTYRGVKFICHNTNSREYEYNGTVPDLNWLKQQFADTDSVSGFVAIAHVPPFSADFDPKYEAAYAGILNNSGKLICSLYAHVGNTGIYYPYGQEEIPYITTGGIDTRSFMIIEIVNGKAATKTIKY